MPVAKKIFKPGEEVLRSGQYGLVGPRGANTGEERTLVKGEPFPPTPKPKMGFVLEDPTYHRKRGK